MNLRLLDSPTRRPALWTVLRTTLWKTSTAIVAGLLLLLPIQAVAQSHYEVVAAFDATGSNIPQPAVVIQAADGTLYGSRSSEVFTVDAAGTLTILHRFSGEDGTDPNRLLQGADGNFYGTTQSGGSVGSEPGYGTVFKMDASGAVTVLHRFSGPDGATPAAPLIQATDGNFYGTTSTGGAAYVEGGEAGNGTVFRIDAAGSFMTMHSFTGPCTTSPVTSCTTTGKNPTTALIQASDGAFYGSTAGGPGPLPPPTVFGSTIFRMDADGTVTTLVLRSITVVSGALIQANDGNLYGIENGRDSYSLFKVTTAGRLSTLYQFPLALRLGEVQYLPAGDLVQGSDGSLYGLAGSNSVAPGFTGTVYKVDLAGSNYSMLQGFSGTGGAAPRGLVKGIDGRFYGTTPRGGPGSSATTPDYGTIFAVDEAGTVATVHAFQLTPTDGATPIGILETSDGTFYGTASTGGLGDGTIFKLASGSLTTLYRFPGDNQSGDGSVPNGGLLQASDGRLLGTTNNFGAFGRGTIFAIDATGGLSNLHHFTASEGSTQNGLIEASDGSFYGSTSTSIFRMDGAGAVTNVHTFPLNYATTPVQPQALIEAPTGTFYGTTLNDGWMRYGTVFSMDPAGTVTTLYTFTGPDGDTPYGRLLYASDGAIYGTTLRGGAIDIPGNPRRIGTVFKLDTAGTFTTLHSFTGGDGQSPTSGLIQASNGIIYGTTSRGGLGYGTLFAIDAAGTLTTLHQFTGADGDNPSGALMQEHDGALYGVTQAGGPNNAGVVFRFTLADGPVTPHPVPGIIEAEDYDTGGPGVGYVDLTPGNDGGAYRNDDVDIKPSSEGGYAVGWMQAGEWLAYTVNVESDGVYTIGAHVGSALPDRTFHIEIDGVDVTGPIAVPLVEDWDHYGDVARTGVSLHAGTQVLHVVMGPDDWMDLQRFSITRQVIGAVIPGKIEAEDYDPGGQGIGYVDLTPGNDGGAYRADDVDIKPSNEGGYAVGWIQAGEWLAYTADVQSDGAYTLSARVGSALPGRTFHLEADGVDVTGPIDVPLMSDWDQYDTVTVAGVALHAGVQRFRVVMGPDDWMDLQWLAFTPEQP